MISRLSGFQKPIVWACWFSFLILKIQRSSPARRRIGQLNLFDVNQLVFANWFPHPKLENPEIVLLIRLVKAIRNFHVFGTVIRLLRQMVGGKKKISGTETGQRIRRLEACATVRCRFSSCCDEYPLISAIQWNLAKPVNGPKGPVWTGPNRCVIRSILTLWKRPTVRFRTLDWTEKRPVRSATHFSVSCYPLPDLQPLFKL